MAFSIKNIFKRKTMADEDKSAVLPVTNKAIKKTNFKKPKKKKFIKSGARYSLIIGEDGAILVYSEGAEVKTRNFIASPSQDNLKELETILSKNIKAPLYMIVDSMDQNFIQQSLPPISSIGVKKLIKRRLDRDLGKDTIKGYVLLEREGSGRRDWNFLMVSLEKSPQFSIWLDFVEKIDNRLAGIYLLSVESENIIKNLDKAMGIVKKKPKKGVPQNFSKWQFFVSNNKVSGFRQVILKDGRIIFTRLGQSVGDATPIIIAGNIEQEMSSTIEYMKRLSFNPSQGLDVYIIASADINAQLDTSRMQADNLYKFTPFEVAGLLGIKGAAQTTDQFGDVVLSAVISGSSSHRLVLSTIQSAKVNSLYNIMVYQRAFVGLLSLGIIGYGGMQALGAWQSYSSLADLNQKKISQQARLDKINEDIKKGGVDIKKVNETVLLYNKLMKENSSPTQFIISVRKAIIPAVSIRNIDWGMVVADKKNNAQGTTDSNEALAVVLRFPAISGTDEAFSSVARKILKDVRAAFPDYDVVYTKLPDALNKKVEGGKIGFDEKTELVEIAPEQLEATLSITRSQTEPNMPKNSNAAGAATDELIGLQRRRGLE
jgi:hypothetical protein